MKNSFHIKNMNVVSPLNELSGDSSGLKHTQMFFPHCGNVQVFVKVDGVQGKGVEGICAAFSALYVGLSTLHEEYTDLPAACHSKDY